ncbi:MAG TPA: ATP-binding protein [Chloroflexia bacterium]|nr:ATP-binding protein [Chloroflexia bacterium]
MTDPNLIIVSGPPSSGKTSLGRKVAKELKLPFIFKDGIKEMLFNTLGWDDQKWAEQLNLATYGILFHFIEAQLQAGLSFVVEGDFKPQEHTEKFKELQRKYHYEPFQLICKADDKVLEERFKERAKSGERHPGHHDKENYPKFKEDLKENTYEALDIGGQCLEVDTTDYDKIDYQQIYSLVRQEAAR